MGVSNTLNSRMITSVPSAPFETSEEDVKHSHSNSKPFAKKYIVCITPLATIKTQSAIHICDPSALTGNK